MTAGQWDSFCVTFLPGGGYENLSCYWIFLLAFKEEYMSNTDSATGESHREVNPCPFFCLGFYELFFDFGDSSVCLKIMLIPLGF